MPQSKVAARARFAHMLGFRTMYRNQQMLTNIQARLNVDVNSNNSMKIDGLSDELRTLFEKDSQLEKQQK